MPLRPAAELLGLPVRCRGIQLGRVVDVVVGVGARRGVGLDVLCGDGVQRFLPLAGAALGEHEIEVESPLVLIEPAESAFYRDRGTSVRRLSGRVLDESGEPRGALRDVVLDGDGEIAELVLENARGVRRVPLEGLAWPPTDGDPAASAAARGW